MDGRTGEYAGRMLTSLSALSLDDGSNFTLMRDAALGMMARIQELEASQEASDTDLKIAMDTMWVLSCGVEICTMQLGFAMLEAGFVREQNVVATYMKNIVDFLISIFAATMGSYNLAYPKQATYVPELGVSVQEHAIRTSFFFHLLFQGAAATIVSGAMAERVTIKGYMAFSLFLSGLVFPLAVRLTWGGGYLSTLDEPFYDFAGSGVVHLVGGSAALAGTVLVGARSGRWDKSQAGRFVPHDLSLVLSGMLILWCGWYGFNSGSSMALSSLETASTVSSAFVSTTVSAASGGATVVILSLIWTKGQSIDVLHMVDAILGGLVSITAGCDVINGWQAMIVGMFAAFVSASSSRAIEKLGIDDVCHATSVHGACGFWGLIAVGLFHTEKGLFTNGTWQLLGTQAKGGVILSSLSAGLSLIFLLFLKFIRALRVSLVEESMGLDAKLGFRAYVRSSERARDFRDIVNVLDTCDHTPKEALEALTSLKQATVLTLTPQAADNKLHGELQDIVSKLDTTDLDNPDWEFFAFASHHKKDGGEVARVFIEGLRSTLHRLPQAAEVVERFADSNLIFLDSNNLRDLSTLLPKVEKTMNIVVLLTKKVLKRPWCIAEITRAHQAGRKILLVLVVWPDKHKDPRSFRMPQDLDEAIDDLASFLRSTIGKKSMGRSSGGGVAPALTSTSGVSGRSGRSNKERPSVTSGHSDESATSGRNSGSKSLAVEGGAGGGEGLFDSQSQSQTESVSPLESGLPNADWQRHQTPLVLQPGISSVTATTEVGSPVLLDPGVPSPAVLHPGVSSMASAQSGGAMAMVDAGYNADEDVPNERRTGDCVASKSSAAEGMCAVSGPSETSPSRPSTSPSCPPPPHDCHPPVAAVPLNSMQGQLRRNVYTI